MPRDHAKFAVFILTHGRPDNVITLDLLKASGYTGRVYLIIDNEDTCGDKYRQRYGTDRVIQFDKAAAEATFDIGDTHTDRRAVVYARNASFGIAKTLGLDYFLQLDDDYVSLRYRWLKGGKTQAARMRVTMDAVIDAMLTFLDDTGAATVAFSQGGDHLSGVHRELRLGILRKAMNSFFFRTDRPIEFLGRINEDTTAYIVHGARGNLFLTVMGIQLDQLTTQANPGGLTDIYLDAGTYVKSFYTVMMAPSCVVVHTMHTTHSRYHHRIRWDHAVPKILNERHRKT